MVYELGSEILLEYRARLVMGQDDLATINLVRAVGADLTTTSADIWLDCYPPPEEPEVAA